MAARSYSVGAIEQAVIELYGAVEDVIAAFERLKYGYDREIDDRLVDELRRLRARVQPEFFMAVWGEDHYETWIRENPKVSARWR